MSDDEQPEYDEVWANSDDRYPGAVRLEWDAHRAGRGLLVAPKDVNNLITEILVSAERADFNVEREKDYDDEGRPIAYLTSGSGDTKMFTRDGESSAALRQRAVNLLATATYVEVKETTAKKEADGTRQKGVEAARGLIRTATAGRREKLDQIIRDRPGVFDVLGDDAVTLGAARALVNKELADFKVAASTWTPRVGQTVRINEPDKSGHGTAVQAAEILPNDNHYIRFRHIDRPDTTGFAVVEPLYEVGDLVRAGDPEPDHASVLIEAKAGDDASADGPNAWRWHGDDAGGWRRRCWLYSPGRDWPTPLEEDGMLRVVSLGDGAAS